MPRVGSNFYLGSEKRKLRRRRKFLRLLSRGFLPVGPTGSGVRVKQPAKQREWQNKDERRGNEKRSLVQNSVQKYKRKVRSALPVLVVSGDILIGIFWNL